MSEEFIPSVNDESGPLWIDSVWELFPNPVAANAHYSGYQGFWGMDVSLLWEMWPVLVFLCAFLLVRRIGYSIAFPHVAHYLGIPPSRKKKVRKFCIQLWLACFYASSTFLNYYLVMQWANFAGFPIREEHRRHFHNYYPDRNPHWKYKFVTFMSCGFYMAELITLFKDVRRTDYREYVVHHSTTIFLLFRSFLAFELKGGLYVVFLHDASDILLSCAKLAHYVKLPDWFVNSLFGLFVVGFIFFRLICFPIFISVRLLNLPRQRAAVVMGWVDSLGLILLLMLQFYWMSLIFQMIYRLARGVKGDVRSDNESDNDACGPPKKSSVTSNRGGYSPK